MKKSLMIFIFIVSLVMLASCKSENVVFIDNGKEKIKVNVEIADNAEERAAGLMFRQFLDDNKGMLFVYQWEDYRSFWMKNTLIPLDMVFISENFEIVDIRYAEPCKKDPCISYVSSKPARYVLEVNGNFTIRNNIAIGNKVNLKIS